MKETGLQINNRKAWMFVTIFWIFIYISTYLLDISATILQGKRNDYYFTMIFQAGWLLWIPLTFLVLNISSHYPIYQKTFFRDVSRHLMFAILIALLYFLCEVVIMMIVMKLLFPQRNVIAYIPFWVITFHVHIIIYFLIVAIRLGSDYFIKLLTATIKNLNLETQLVEAQNAALKMQIQPHFLFNTHHSIISLMMQGQNEQSIKMLTGLSELLRKTLELPDKNYITVEEEIAFIKLYLNIQQIRFGDRLQISYRIEPLAATAIIPALSLQPLIENSIIHGIEPFSDSGHLIIQARVIDDRLELSVSDDGVGFSKNSVKEGIGLANIRSRLQNLFKENFNFKLETINPKGTLAIINIPLIYK